MATFAAASSAGDEAAGPSSTSATDVAAAEPAVRTTGGAGLPVTQQRAALINGTHTEVVVSSFADRVVVVVSQLGKPGTLLNATAEESAEFGGRRYEVKVLLGRRDDPLLAV